MKKVIKILGICLCFLIVFSFLQCGKKTSTNCKSKKIELLLEDILRKKSYFPAYDFQITEIYDLKTHKYIDIPPDSSLYFGYLLSPKLKIPDKEFYLHCDNEPRLICPDSVKLRVINNRSQIEAHVYTVGVYPIEFNEDSTKLKIEIDFGTDGTAWDWGTLTYLFDTINCKWITLDSTKLIY